MHQMISIAFQDPCLYNTDFSQMLLALLDIHQAKESLGILTAFFASIASKSHPFFHNCDRILR